MKKFLISLCLFATTLFAQTSTVESPSAIAKGSKSNDLLADFGVASGRAVTFKSGSTLVLASGGTISAGGVAINAAELGSLDGVDQNIATFMSNTTTALGQKQPFDVNLLTLANSTPDQMTRLTRFLEDAIIKDAGADVTSIDGGTRELMDPDGTIVADWTSPTLRVGGLHVEPYDGTGYGTISILGIDGSQLITGGDAGFRFATKNLSGTEVGGAYLEVPTNGKYGILTFAGITDNRTYQFPNSSGMLALLNSPAFTGTVTLPAALTSPGNVTFTGLNDKYFKVATNQNGYTQLVTNFANGINSVGTNAFGASMSVSDTDSNITVNSSVVYGNGETTTTGYYMDLYDEGWGQPQHQIRVVHQNGFGYYGPFVQGIAFEAFLTSVNPVKLSLEADGIKLNGPVGGSGVSDEKGAAFAGKLAKLNESGNVNDLIDTSNLSVQFRRGTDAEREVGVPANGEAWWTTDAKRLWIGDGATLGGNPVLPLGYSYSVGDGIEITSPTGVSSTSSYFSGYASGAWNIDAESISVTSTDNMFITAGMSLSLSADNTSIYSANDLNLTGSGLFTLFGNNDSYVTTANGSILEVNGGGGLYLKSGDGYGIVLQPGAGATLSVNPGSNPTTEQQGLWLGPDAALFRSAANALRTNDAFHVGGKLTTTATASAAAINVGSYAGHPGPLSNGDLWYDTTAGQYKTYRIGSVVGSIATENNTLTLTSKSIALGSNTLTGTSAQFATAISDETGSGAAVFATNPTLTSPVITTGLTSSGTNTATSAQQTFFSVTPTYNQASGTAANTDLLINRTQTAVGSGAQRLIDAQVGGESLFQVTNTGQTRSIRATTGGGQYMALDGGDASGTYLRSLGADKAVQFHNVSGTSGNSFNMFVFAGGTNGVPATPFLQLSASRQSNTASSLSGYGLDYGTITFTDSGTAAAGTATNRVAHAFARPTLAASNTGVTTTNAATVYIANSPAAGTNQTITNPYALWVDDGVTRLDGNMTTGATNFTFTGSSAANSEVNIKNPSATGSMYLTAGSDAGRNSRIYIGANGINLKPNYGADSMEPSFSVVTRDAVPGQTTSGIYGEVYDGDFLGRKHSFSINGTPEGISGFTDPADGITLLAHETNFFTRLRLLNAVVEVTGDTLQLDNNTVTGTAVSTSTSGGEGKLAVTNADGNINGLIDTANLSVQFRRGTDGERAVGVPANGEAWWTTDLKKLWVGDGTTLGGVPVQPPGYDYDVNSNIAIATTGSVSVSGATLDFTAAGLGYLSFNGETNGLVSSPGVLLELYGGGGLSLTSSSISINGGVLWKRTAVAATTTVNRADNLIAVTDTSAPRTVNLPTAVGFSGQQYIVKDESGGAATNNITVDPDGSETVDGASTTVINTNYGCVVLYSNGTNWFIISKR